MAYSWGNPSGSDPALTGTGVLTGAHPNFRSRGGFAFAPAGAPLVNAGVLRPWMAGATDLAGNPRVIGRRPDIGALESPPAGTVIELR